MGEKLFTIQNHTTVNLPFDFQIIVYGLLILAVLLISVDGLFSYWTYKTQKKIYEEQKEETRTVTRLVQIIKRITKKS